MDGWLDRLCTYIGNRLACEMASIFLSLDSGLRPRSLHLLGQCLMRFSNRVPEKFR